VGNEGEHIESSTAGIINTETKLVKSKEEMPISILAIQQGIFHFAASSFSYPSDSSSLHSLGKGRILGGGSKEDYYSSCLHVKPVCRRASLLHIFVVEMCVAYLFEIIITRYCSTFLQTMQSQVHPYPDRESFDCRI
jgi:hypothetical protein